MINMTSPSLRSRPRPSLEITDRARPRPRRSTSMENTVDSNSESDISENWAVIDEDSPLEWDSDVGLRYHFRRSTSRPRHTPRPSSSNEQSDEDSIEVVPDDHADSVCEHFEAVPDDHADSVYKDSEVAPDEMWPVAGIGESFDNIHTAASSLEHPDVLPLQCKGNSSYMQHNLILIIILTLSIVGGLLGYLWVFHSHKLEDSTSSVNSARTLLTKLQLENQYLRRKLRSAHSSLKLAVPKFVPKLKLVTTLELLDESNGKSKAINYLGSSFATDFMVPMQTSYENSTRDYCLPSDKGNMNFKNFCTDNFDISDNSFKSCRTPTFSSTNLEVKHGEIVNTSAAQNRSHKNINKSKHNVNRSGHTFYSPSKKSSIVGLIDDLNNNQTFTASAVVSGSGSSVFDAEKEIYKSISDGRTDPRPYTRFRSIVERIYTLMAVISNESQIVLLPPKLEILHTVSENFEDLDLLLKENVPPTIHEKITSFKMQMEDTTQKLFDDIDASIDNLVDNIAYKVTQSQTNARKQLCSLKTRFENDKTVLLDWHSISIFHDCSEEKMKNDNGASAMGDSINKMKDFLSENIVVNNTDNKEFMIRNSFGAVKEEQDQQTPDRMERMKEHKDKAFNQEKNDNLQQIEEGNGNIEPDEYIEISSVSGAGKNCGLNKKSKKGAKSVLKQKPVVVSIKGNVRLENVKIKLKHKNKKDNFDKERSKKKWKAAAMKDKSGSKGSEADIGNNRYETFDKKKSFDSKKNKYDEPTKKQKNLKKSKKLVVDDMGKASNVSGEWTIKMAHGRAEQRRRDHQSDWLFDRAQLRKSNRENTDNRVPYWRNGRDYSPQHHNSDVCDKNMTHMERILKTWKEKKLWIRDNLSKPFVTTAKSAKKAFNKFNSKMHYQSRQE